MSSQTTNPPAKIRKPYLWYFLGFIGILCLVSFVVLNYLSVEGPRMFDTIYVNLAGPLFFGGEALIAISSIAIGAAKRRLGLGLLMVLLGPVGFLIMFFIGHRTSTDILVQTTTKASTEDNA
jgi:hypothetical protein